MTEERERKLKRIMENDRIHDQKFEDYLNICGWTSKHKLADPYGLGVENITNSRESSESANTTGSFHGDNVRYNLFPDSTDQLNSFDAETDRLSLLSFRTTNTQNEGLDYEPEHENIEEIVLNFNENGHSDDMDDADDISQREEIEGETVHEEREGAEEENNEEGEDGEEEEEEEEEDDDDDEEEEFGIPLERSIQPIERPVTTIFTKMFDNLLTPKVFRKNDFEYYKLDYKIKQMCPKQTNFKQDLDHGFPLDSSDTWNNYDRSKINVQPNWSYLDSIKEAENPMFAIKNQPAGIYGRSILKVEALSQSMLSIPNLGIFGSSGYFKSNLSVIFDYEKYKILIVAIGSRLTFFEFTDDINNEVDKFKFEQWTYVGHLDVQFQSVDNHQFYHAVNPNEPYSINYITKSFIDFEDYTNNNQYNNNINGDNYCNVLIIANDYSQVIIFDLKELGHAFFTDIEESITEKEQLQKEFWNNKDITIFEMNTIYNSRFIFKTKNRLFEKPLRVKSSVWCVGVFNDYIIISDNSRVITIFQVDYDSIIYKTKSQELQHNIPYLDISQGPSCILVICGTYSGYQYLLTYTPNMNNFVIGDCIELDGPIWSCKFIPKECFLNVQSFELLTGSTTSVIQPEDILNHSKILGILSNKTENSDLGIAKYFTHLKIPSISSRHIKKYPKYLTIVKNEKLQLQRKREFFDNWYGKYERNKNKDRDNEYNDEDNKSIITDSFLNDESFFITCTNKSIGLMNTYQMINLGTCKNAFPIINEPYIIKRSNEFHIDYENNLANNFLTFRPDTQRLEKLLPTTKSFLNRIYLIQPMFSINAIAIATQAGQVSIYRFTKYRGMHSMRLEWVLIDAEKYIMSRNGDTRTLIGLSASNLGYDNNGDEIWMLSVIYNDFLTLNYKVQKDINSDCNNKINELSIFNVI